MKYEDKTLKVFIRDIINLYFKPIKDILNNEDFMIPFSLFLLGLIPYCFAVYFNISVFLTSLSAYLIEMCLTYYITHVYSVLVIGIMFSLSYSFIWYLIHLFFV